jgi:hypothetical protein
MGVIANLPSQAGGIVSPRVHRGDSFSPLLKQNVKSERAGCVSEVEIHAANSNSRPWTPPF